MPAEVRAEVVPAASARGFAAQASILHAQRQGWLQVAGPTPTAPALPDLDEGESACIRIALAHPHPTRILMDERAAPAVAQAMGLSVADTAALIGMAKSRGLTGSATEVFARLHGSDFRISAEVIRAILKRVGESQSGRHEPVANGWPVRCAIDGFLFTGHPAPSGRLPVALAARCGETAAETGEFGPG